MPGDEPGILLFWVTVNAASKVSVMNITLAEAQGTPETVLDDQPV
jgi:hypothetical protein